MAGLHNFVQFGLLLFLSVQWTWAIIPEQELHPWYWNKMGRDAIDVSLRMTPIVGKAKNLVLFLGDGMGVPTVTATRILKGQLAGFNGEETSLAMDTFPYLALSKTYNVNQQMPDSAGTATAYLCGVKANYGTLGVSARIERGKCSGNADNDVVSVLHRAKMAGKSVGIVTTTRVQHASPGANYAHTPDRGWYSDIELPADAVRNGCRDIAWQLIKNTEINVILGGGRQYMFSNITADPEYPTYFGERSDGKDLVQEWLQGKKNAKYVVNKEGLDAVDASKTDFLMGLFEPKDCQYEYKRDTTTDPSLTQMMEKAIKILKRNPKGFYLFVEDKGRIDHGHHDGNAQRALTEAVEFDRAIERAAQLTSEKDTLTVVTADHSHVFAFGGHSQRGNSVFGVSRELATDKKSFTTAVYGNGPGYQIKNGIRPDVNATVAAEPEYHQQAAVPKNSETHAIEDVPIFAKGPMAHLFHGVQEQSYIAHVLAYAACLPPYEECDLEDNHSVCLHPSSVLVLMSLLLALISSSRSG
ncbi:unnamed protein product [Arctogadus glacialis]